MTSRVAAISFLNTWPLVDALEKMPPDRVRLTYAVPSALPELLHADEADVALIPVAEWFRGAGAGFVPGVAIATRGPVDSVKLFSRKPPTEIAHVAVDRGSRTSVALLRILFADLYDVQPDFRVVVPQVETLLAEEEAVLVIGDRCFAAERRFRSEGRDDVHIIDLGETWRQMTGLPFVFAVWAYGREFSERAGEAGRRELARLLTDARDAGMANVDALAARAAAEGRLGPGGANDPAAIASYFRDSMRYVLGPQELAGLRRFHTLCLRHHIVPPGREIDDEVSA